MIQKGADLNAQNANGETALHHACWSKNISILNVLLDNGANISAVTSSGETCLHWAVRSGSVELVDYLLKRGADRNIKGKFGTALDVVAQMGDLPAMRNLFEKQPSRTASTRSVDDFVPPSRMVPSIPVESKEKGTIFSPISSTDSQEEEENLSRPIFQSQEPFFKGEYDSLSLDKNKYADLMSTLRHMEDVEEDGSSETKPVMFPDLFNLNGQLPPPPSFDQGESDIPEFDADEVPPPEE
jgi:hypothetical protein